MDKSQDDRINEQVDLPFGIAFGIVMQGFRIRFGRSLITIFGVILGIAFLMSNLANQIIRDAVRDEEQLRSTVKRMTSFLYAETGPPEGKSFGVVQCGPLAEAEIRLVNALYGSGLSRLNWTTVSGVPPQAVQRDALHQVSLEDVAQDTRGILIVGAGALSGELVRSLSTIPRQVPVAVSDMVTKAEAAALAFPVVTLSTAPTAEERDKIAADKRAQGFRKRWILVISLLVTVMGIANAMLMSVTERFREIGTMKCLGAKSAFIRRLFLIESSLMGFFGGLCGVAAGALFSLAVNCSVYGVGMLRSLDIAALAAASGVALLAGVVLSVIAAINPANVAASMTPSHALRANV